MMPSNPIKGITKKYLIIYESRPHKQCAIKKTANILRHTAVTLYNYAILSWLFDLTNASIVHRTYIPVVYINYFFFKSYSLKFSTCIANGCAATYGLTLRPFRLCQPSTIALLITAFFPAKIRPNVIAFCLAICTVLLRSASGNRNTSAIFAGIQKIILLLICLCAHHSCVRSETTFYPTTMTIILLLTAQTKRWWKSRYVCFTFCIILHFVVT